MGGDGTFDFPTVMPDVPADMLARCAAGARASDRTVDKGAKHIVYRFPSVERMCAFGAMEEADPRCQRRLFDLRQPNDPWSGASLPAAMWMGTVAGWSEAVALAVGVYDTLVAKRLASRIPVPMMAEEPGDEVDVASYLAGDDPFLSMAVSDRVGVGRGAVVVRHNLFVSASESVEAIVTRGVVAAAVVHLLETSGVQVAIDLDMNASGGGDYSLDLLCRLKDFGVPVDLPRLVYWLAHPSVLRRVVFAATARHFTTHYDKGVKDAPDVVRVGRALRGGGVEEVVAATLAAAGIELEG